MSEEPENLVLALVRDMRGDIAGLRSEFRGEMAEFRSEIRSELHTLRADVASDMIDLEKHLTEKIAGLRRAALFNPPEALFEFGDEDAVADRRSVVFHDAPRHRA